jgi:CBS domain-containing protein
MSNADEFLTAFSSIEHTLRRLDEQGRDMSFVRRVDLLSARNRLVAAHSIDLKQYAELRNALVHERTGNGEIIAQPHDDVVASIQRIAALLASPPRVLPLFQRPVYSVRPDDSLAEALRGLVQHAFSQTPVYDGNTYAGLLTTNAVARWLGAQQSDVVRPGSVRVAAVLAFNEGQEQALFVDRNTTQLDALELFQTTKRGGRLEALLITHNGKPSEKPLGIITAHDLPQLSAALGLSER